MTMGIEAILDQFLKVIREITPKLDSDIFFTCVNDGTGVEQRLEEPNVPERFFEIRSGFFPIDAGFTGFNGVMLDNELIIRVRYNLVQDFGLTERKISLDVAAITQNVLNPFNWDASNTGISTIIPPVVDDIELTLSDDESFGVLEIPFVVQYREIL